MALLQPGDLFPNGTASIAFTGGTPATVTPFSQSGNAYVFLETIYPIRTISDIFTFGGGPTDTESFTGGNGTLTGSAEVGGKGDALKMVFSGAPVIGRQLVRSGIYDTSGGFEYNLSFEVYLPSTASDGTPQTASIVGGAAGVTFGNISTQDEWKFISVTGVPTSTDQRIRFRDSNGNNNIGEVGDEVFIRNVVITKITPPPLSGSTFTALTASRGEVIDGTGYRAGIVTSSGSKFTFTPAVDIPSGRMLIKATGNIGLEIT